jgi:hypothetical protein
VEAAALDATDDAPPAEPDADAEEAPEPTLETLRFDDDPFRAGPRRFSVGAPGGVARSPWAPLQPAEDDYDDETASASAEAPAAELAEAVGEAAPAASLAPAPAEPPMATLTDFARVAGDDMSDVYAAMGEINRKLDSILALLQGPAPAMPARAVNDGNAEWQGGRVTSIGAAPRAVFREAQAPAAAVAPPPPPPLDTHLAASTPLAESDPRRGLELLPRSYRITVEDKRQGVDLVPLHRALLGMDGVKDMSLLSYNNGIAIVALDTNGDIEPDTLRASVSRAMAREARVEVHNENTMVVKLAED